MTKRLTQRYCADPQALAAMKRDGLGWGHDLECGCFEDAAPPPRSGALSRLVNTLRRRA